MRFSRSKTSFAALAVVAAGAIAGCGSSGSSAPAQSKPAESQKAAMHRAADTHSATASAEESKANAAAPAPKTVKLIVKSDDEHGKKGPEGTWHDAFLPANFTVEPGQKVNVVVLNYDEGKHSFTSPLLGVNVTIDEGSEKAPHKTTFSFTAPTKAGEYEWFCDFPCDPWSMTHKGFMRGDVTVS